MGTDTALAVLSNRSRMLYDYFTQQFAQVTNPPLDAIREEFVTAVGCTLGPEGNLFAPGPDSCRQIFLRDPDPRQRRTRQAAGSASTGKAAQRFPHDHVAVPLSRRRRRQGLQRAIEARTRTRARKAIDEGHNIVVLSDRGATVDLAPIPMLLATAAVHHHLIRAKTRTRIGLVVETGEAREVHHFCLLFGFGAAAINPYLAFESIDHLIDEAPPRFAGTRQEGRTQELHQGVERRRVEGDVQDGHLHCAELHRRADLRSDRHRQGSHRRILHRLRLPHRWRRPRRDRARDSPFATISPHPENPTERAHRELVVRRRISMAPRRASTTSSTPRRSSSCNTPPASGRYDIFKQYTTLVDDQAAHLATLRGLFSFNSRARPPVSIDEVESVADIVKRFSTGAMSYGSISKEAHETLAIAMNRIGGRSNTGEGGEDNDRYLPDPNGDLRRSAIKQVASGRFGVTSEYLVNADDLQIKMAQGAKPGEGGQLPGNPGPAAGRWRGLGRRTARVPLLRRRSGVRGRDRADGPGLPRRASRLVRRRRRARPGSAARDRRHESAGPLGGGAPAVPGHAGQPVLGDRGRAVSWADLDGGPTDLARYLVGSYAVLFGDDWSLLRPARHELAAVARGLGPQGVRLYPHDATLSAAYAREKDRHHRQHHRHGGAGAALRRTSCGPPATPR